jgi:ElaB/YqjD/DUF883 family membrane-anchored ribosome-binding protein
MPATIEAVQETVAERLSPALDTVEESVRDARRAITQGKYALEDFASGTALQVRRHPLTAVALAGASGALAGWLCGLVVGWRVSRRANKTRE